MKVSIISSIDVEVASLNEATALAARVRDAERANMQAVAREFDTTPEQMGITDHFVYVVVQQ